MGHIYTPRINEKPGMKKNRINMERLKVEKSVCDKKVSCIPECVRARVCACIYNVRIHHVCTCVRAGVRTCMCMYACVRVCVCVWS